MQYRENMLKLFFFEFLLNLVINDFIEIFRYNKHMMSCIKFHSTVKNLSKEFNFHAPNFERIRFQTIYSNFDFKCCFTVIEYQIFHKLIRFETTRRTYH